MSLECRRGEAGVSDLQAKAIFLPNGAISPLPAGTKEIPDLTPRVSCTHTTRVYVHFTTQKHLMPTQCTDQENELTSFLAVMSPAT